MQTSALSFVEAGLSALERSLRDHEGELRNVQLATISAEGRPGLRTLVLRAFDRSEAYAEMHTEARAGKARDIAHASEVTFLAWSAADHLQLRFEGRARLHRDDDVARARWEKLSANARNMYGLRAEPGTPITDPEDQSHLPPEDQFKQFTVILVSLDTFDILRLEPGGGQTRACGSFSPAGITGRWIGP